jgi:hypothetical protein
MKRLIKDVIVLGIIVFMLGTSYNYFIGNYETFGVIWWSIVFLSVGISYVVKHILEKYFKMKF